MGAGQITALVFGILCGLFGLALLGTGGTVLWADQTQRDETGWASTGFEPFGSSAYAIVSEGFEVNEEIPTWLLSESVAGEVRVEADGGDEELFLGLAETADVDAYLNGVEHDVVTDLDFDPFRATYRRVAGGAPPGPPGDETFWVDSASGTGVQTLRWELERGTWTFVLMNADGGAPVQAELAAAAEAPFLVWVAIGLLVVGLLFLLLAGLLLYAALRRPPVGPASQPPASTAVEPERTSVVEQPPDETA
jgi:hypothetical protein